MNAIDEARSLLAPDAPTVVSNPEWRRLVAGLLTTIDGLIAAKLPAGGQCAECGFRYFEYKGHIIPCPVCVVGKLRVIEPNWKRMFCRWFGHDWKPIVEPVEIRAEIIRMVGGAPIRFCYCARCGFRR